MIFLLNNERVLAEIIELAKSHIAELLEIKIENVKVDLELALGGVIKPTFNVLLPNVGALERDYIKNAIAQVWVGWAKQELVDRLKGLQDVKIDGFKR